MTTTHPLNDKTNSLNSTFSVITSITARAVLNFALFLHNNVEFPLDVSSVSQCSSGPKTQTETGSPSDSEEAEKKEETICAGVFLLVYFGR